MPTDLGRHAFTFHGDGCYRHVPKPNASPLAFTCRREAVGMVPDFCQILVASLRDAMLFGRSAARRGPVGDVPFSPVAGSADRRAVEAASRRGAA